MKPCPKGHKDCPHPSDDTFAEIEFTPQKKMVDWLGPLQLADTGFKAVVAATFGSYADKREVEVAVSPFDGVEYLDLSNTQNEVWFDYIADLGDGFNPSYAMAYLMAKETLTVDDHQLPRGEVVILGGDQVYPTSSRDEYQNKFIGPYRSALPWRPEGETRNIHAIPGNHDWYDGLTSFLRIFCQARDKTGRGARWIGAWRASQRRSYFAIRLPGNWWVWGVDGQLESDMDKPQLNYFSDLGDKIREMGGGEAKIVLVTPEPNWVYCGGVGSDKLCALVEPERFNTLAHFEKRYVRAKGLRLTMVIAGDLHHYVRYTSEDGGAHRITCGGGGAYMLGTHQMPELIVVREGTTETSSTQEPKRTYKRTNDTMYPRPKDSKRIALGVWLLGVRNKTFAFFLGLIYLLFAWVVESASRSNDLIREESLLAAYRGAGTVGDVWNLSITAIRFSPASVIFVLVVIVGLGLFTASQKDVKPAILSWIGYVHGVLHMLVALGLMWAIANLTSRSTHDPIFTVQFTVLMLALGWTAGATLFAVYIHLASKFTGGHTNEVYSSQAIEGYKNFMRFCVRNGELHVYPIGVKDIPNKWRFNPERDCRDPFFEPVGTKITPAIIDGPFVVR